MRILLTERLILRPFKETDLSDFYEYAKVKGVGEAAGWKHHTSIEESKEILSIFMQNPLDFAIVHKQDNKMIGTIGFKTASLDGDDDIYKQLEIGYVLSKDYWNQGLMSEAVSKAIEFVFKTLNVDRLVIGHFFKNERSKRIIEKMGFQYVKDDIFHSKSLNQSFDEKKYVLYNNQRT